MIGVIFVGLVILGMFIDSQPILDDDMSSGEGPFIAESDPLVDLRYEDGGYAMVLSPMDGGQRQAARHIWSPALPTQSSIHLGISYEVRAAPDASEWGLYLGCFGAGGFYWYVSGGDGSGFVLYETIQGEFELLAEDMLPSLSRTGRFELECIDGDEGEPTEIIAYRDGKEHIRTSHRNGFGSFSAMAISTGVDVRAEMDVLWDDAYADGDTNHGG